MTIRGKASRRDAGVNHTNAFTPIGTHITNAALSALVVLTPPSDSVNALLIEALAQPIRYTLDGTTTPTATVGFLLPVGVSVLIILTEETSTVRIIETAVSATANIQWGAVATNT